MRILATAFGLALLAQPALADTQVRLGLDWSYLPYHAPIAIGLEKGYFADEGIDLVVEPGRGSATTAVMLGEANYDIAHINTTNAAVAISKGIPIKVIAVYQTKTASSFIGVADRVDLSSGVEAIKSYRIGSTPGGSDQLGLRIFRALNGLSESDLNVVTMDGPSKQAALLSESIDLISGDGFAYAAIIRSKGLEPVVFALSDYGVPLLGFGYSVNTKFAAEHPDAVKGFLRAMKRGWQDAVADVPAACELAREKFELPHTQQACEDYFSGLLGLSVSPNDPAWGRQSDEMWSALLAALAAVGEVQGDYKVSDYYTNEYLPAE